MALTNGQRAKTSYKNGTYIQTKKTHGFDVTKLMDLTYGQRAKTSYENGKYIQTTLRKQNSWLWRNKTKQLWQTEPKYGNAITEPKYGGTGYEGNKKYIYISRCTRLKIAHFNPFFKQIWQNSFHILWLLFLQPYRPLCLLLQTGDYSYIFFY